MNIIFRVDASIEIGTGHVMRCLTLANALARTGKKCHFICRLHYGNLINTIAAQGHKVYTLPIQPAFRSDPSIALDLIYQEWLGALQVSDAKSSEEIIQSIRPDCVIVDHYGISSIWERIIRKHCRKLMVIDDLANREHECDILLDQTFGRVPEDYYPVLPQKNLVMCGAKYSVLRPEFSLWRNFSINRRLESPCRNLMINLGGVDKDNITSRVIEALGLSSSVRALNITVVMGANSPWLSDIKELARHSSLKLDIKVGVNDMAKIMTYSDLAIGAAGATSWERCCLGLATIMLPVASNQNLIAANLHEAKAALLTNLGQLRIDTEGFLKNDGSLINKYSKNCLQITDGEGCSRVVRRINE